jgi:hypothetical protein
MNYRYQNINIKKQDGTRSQYYVNNVYPEVPLSPEDTYVIATLGDRLFWWVIASANALPGDSLYLEPGSQIRIPANLSGIINTYKTVNILR